MKNKYIFRCLDVIAREYGGEVVNKNQMANPDQKIILLERAFEELKGICIKFQVESSATDMEVKTLLKEFARVYEKDIDEDLI